MGREICPDSIEGRLKRLVRACGINSMPVCHNCGEPATCMGTYMGDSHEFSCDKCCDHSCKDGFCVQLAEFAQSGVTEGQRTGGVTMGYWWHDIETAALKALEPLMHATPDSIGATENSNTSSGVMRLFAYYTLYSKDTPGRDPIVAGIACIQNSEGVLVRGDFCGEETGTLVLEEFASRIQVKASPEEVLGAVQKVAARLCEGSGKLNELLLAGGIPLDT